MDITTEEQVMATEAPIKIKSFAGANRNRAGAYFHHAYCTVTINLGDSSRYDVYAQYEGEEVRVAGCVTKEEAISIINSANSRIFWGEEL